LIDELSPLTSLIRIGKNKAKVSLNAKVESIQYYKDRVFVGLANQTVAVFTRGKRLTVGVTIAANPFTIDATGAWQTTPTIVEGVHCYRFCVVMSGTNGPEQLWTTSLNVIQIRNEELQTVEVCRLSGSLVLSNPVGYPGTNPRGRTGGDLIHGGESAVGVSHIAKLCLHLQILTWTAVHPTGCYIDWTIRQ